MDNYLTDNMARISYRSSSKKPWAVICSKTNKILAKFETLDEVKDYCQNSGLELIYWPSSKNKP